LSPDPRRALLIAPHFPPDSGAATHRVRLLAPYLDDFGWTPTVLTVNRESIEGTPDPELEAMVPADLHVARARALTADQTRKVGIGDLGIRSFKGLWTEAVNLMSRDHYAVVFITIFPTYTALLGPALKKRFGSAFVLDYIDPWVSEWGKSVGGGPGGRVDIKARMTRAAALALEPLVVRTADAITAVSSATYEAIFDRHPALRSLPSAAIPYGGDEHDFEWLRLRPRANPFFDPADGLFHLCYVGTLLPLGGETLRAVLEASALVRDRSPEIYRKLKLHFFGTSNQTGGSQVERVMPVARETGVSDIVDEHPVRIAYLDALNVQVQASAVLMMGSTEHHYTASKLYPALLSRRPVVAVYHEKSSVADITARVASPPAGQLVTYDDVNRASSRVRQIADALETLVKGAPWPDTQWNLEELSRFSARSLAGELAAVFDKVARP
jgi:hypothetical protein